MRGQRTVTRALGPYKGRGERRGKGRQGARHAYAASSPPSSRRSRMLKKSASGVLAALRDSTLSRSVSDAGSLEGLFRSPRPIIRANGPHKVRYVPLRLFACCGLADGLSEQPASEDELGHDIARLLRGEPVKKVTSLWALLQNGVSMSRTSIGILQCPYTPMIRWALP